MIRFESIHNILFRLKGFIVPLNRPAVSLAFSILASSISSDSEAINQAQLSIPTSIGGRSSNDCVFSFAHTIYLTHILPGHWLVRLRSVLVRNWYFNLQEGKYLQTNCDWQKWTRFNSTSQYMRASHSQRTLMGRGSISGFFHHEAKPCGPVGWWLDTTHRI